MKFFPFRFNNKKKLRRKMEFYTIIRGVFRGGCSEIFLGVTFSNKKPYSNENVWIPKQNLQIEIFETLTSFVQGGKLQCVLLRGRKREKERERKKERKGEKRENDSGTSKYDSKQSPTPP